MGNEIAVLWEMGYESNGIKFFLLPTSVPGVVMDVKQVLLEYWNGGMVLRLKQSMRLRGLLVCSRRSTHYCS